MNSIDWITLEVTYFIWYLPHVSRTHGSTQFEFNPIDFQT